jgi:hypothetical protein
MLITDYDDPGSASFGRWARVSRSAGSARWSKAVMARRCGERESDPMNWFYVKDEPLDADPDAEEINPSLGGTWFGSSHPQTILWLMHRSDHFCEHGW